MAMVLAYGAVGMSSKSKEQAYEYLMLLLNDKAEQEKGAEFTPLQGMLNTSGVPVQERAWKSALEQSGVYDAASQERIMQSFTELDGAYFASEEERNLNRKVGQMIQQAMQMDKNEIQEACAREAAQAAKAYEVMVKE